MNRPNKAQAVILAAGASTRTHPLTVTRPKPLLPIANRPLLQHTLDHLDGLVDEVILVVGFMQDQIRAAFGERYGSVDLRYCVQEEQRGTGHALQQARPLVSAPFLLLNGDDLIHRHDLEQLLVYPCAVLGQLVPDPQHFGILELGPDGSVTRIIEKPQHFGGRPLASTGAFHFQPEALELLDQVPRSERGEYELVDIIGLLPLGSRCTPVTVSEYWLPVGFPWKLLDANRLILERGLGSTRALSGGALTRPVLIGDGSAVGAGCRLGPGTTIGRNCEIGTGSELVNCLVMDGARIGRDCYLADSIIGENAVVGDGCRTAVRPAGGGTVQSAVKGKLVDTGRETLGVTLADGVEIGERCLFAAGVKVWPHVQLPAGAFVQVDVFTV